MDLKEQQTALNLTLESGFNYSINIPLIMICLIHIAGENRQYGLSPRLYISRTALHECESSALFISMEESSKTNLHQWIILIDPDLKLDQNNGNHLFGLNVAGQCEFSEHTCTHLSVVDCKKREINLKICVSEKVCLYCNIV